MKQKTANSVRKTSSVEEWKQRIAVCRGSGQSVRNWCEENGVSNQSYYRWERKLRSEAAERIQQSNTKEITAVGNRFVEIPVTKSAEETVAIIRSVNTVCEVKSGISSQLLAALLKALNDHA